MTADSTWNNHSTTAVSDVLRLLLNINDGLRAQRIRTALLADSGLVNVVINEK
jgi:hypothetical protein